MTQSGRLGSVDAIVEKYAVSSNPLRRIIYVTIGCIFLVFAGIGILLPGWPTVSWAVPAAFLFSLSNERLFRYTLTNRFFGSTMFEYYATGKTLPSHVKYIITMMIAAMSSLSAYFVWSVSTRGVDGKLLQPNTWSGADEFALGSLTIIGVGILGILYVFFKVNTRDTN
ncbi:MAG: DUF454 domain-containing protein [Candidatus Poseidoniales archaeon]|nr:MAG: hypothetical protein CBE15_04365 [Euryarchaeota archaeon TMED255]RAH11246.1 MAG: hypothetical protein CMA23_002665 [Euryarchaeota archaeon]RCH73340.1 MAG: DUF454 domain-containing protein [Candidatus Poseidoniales archaeon]|tara:strand:- start:4548 stop:5054 length:507 start_codon:yes stop_codon:yes gene_type:complete